MYKTNMRYSLFINYLDFLLEKKLLEKKTSNPSGATIYKITEQGREVLEDIKNVLGYVK